MTNTTIDPHKEANAQAKAAKAYSKAQRPFYKKKRFIIPVALLVLIGIGGVAGGSGDEPAVSQTTSTASAELDESVEELEAVLEEPAEEAPAEPEAPSLTAGQENALQSASDYLDYSAFSKKGLIEQLEFEGFTAKDAQFAVNNLKVDWNEQAAKSAEDYLSYSSFSKSGLIEQLEFEGFTSAQAQYGANQAY